MKQERYEITIYKLVRNYPQLVRKVVIGPMTQDEAYETLLTTRAALPINHAASMTYTDGRNVVPT